MSRKGLEQPERGFERAERDDDIRETAHLPGLADGIDEQEGGQRIR